MSESKRFDWRDWFSAYRVRSRLILNFGLPDTDRIKCDSIELVLFHMVMYSVLSVLVGNWGVLVIGLSVDAFLIYRQNKKYLREHLGGYPMVECSMAIHLAWFSKVRRFAAYVYLSDNDDNLVIHFSIPWLIELEISLDTPETILGQFITSKFLLKRKDRSRKGLRRFFKSNGGSFFTGFIITWDSFTLGFLHNEMDSSAQTCLSFQIFVDYSLDDTLMGSYTPVSRNEFLRDNVGNVKTIILCDINTSYTTSCLRVVVPWYEETQDANEHSITTKVVVFYHDPELKSLTDFLTHYSTLIHKSTLLPKDIKPNDVLTSQTLHSLYNVTMLGVTSTDGTLNNIFGVLPESHNDFIYGNVITFEGKLDLSTLRDRLLNINIYPIAE